MRKQSDYNANQFGKKPEFQFGNPEHRPKPMQTVALHCPGLKQAIYKVKKHVDAIANSEHRERAQRLWQEAYDSWDRLQDFCNSK